MQFLDLKKFKIPDGPGVYFFKKGRDILYVGRATSLRDRTKSYFSPDIIVTRGPRIVDMVTKATVLKWQETDSVLEAVILEANLIKKLQPHYNVQEKDDKSFNYVVITKEKFPRIIVVRGKDLSVSPHPIGDSFGPFTSSAALKESLRIIRKMFPFLDERSYQKRQSPFYRQIGLSPETANEESRKEYLKNIRHIRLFFQGKKGVVVKSLTREMKLYAKAREFEKAAEIRGKIFALEHVRDVSLIKEDNQMTSSRQKVFRIEAYDVAHTSGKESVGVMIVFIDGEKAPSEYRKFKLDKDIGNDDTKSLAEVLRRRFNHPEWGMPDMIVIDGGKAQLDMAKKSEQEYFRARSFGKAHKEENTAAPFSRPVIISVVKDDKHKARAILGTKFVDKALEKIILFANAEAHRFAIVYHRKLRNFDKRKLF
jgi:excinuclease ABC subunit C